MIHIDSNRRQPVTSREKVGVLVLGPTGAGKSSFISTVTDSPVIIGHNITSGKTSFPLL
jgi:predicted GTPase